jgi:dienelactone hydrolase
MRTFGVMLEVEPAVALAGDLALADAGGRTAEGLVLFAHGSGSSRHSPRNQAVARGLQDSGFATLLMDLLTEEEGERDAVTAELRFAIDLLTGRLVGAVDWLAQHPATGRLPVGLFGASTGAAAALAACAARPDRVAAVVSRGGRPDLAGPALQRVRAPVLLIVGGADPEVLTLNQKAAQSLAGPVDLQVIPGATHLFEEPGALDQVTRLAADWFHHHLPASTNQRQ